MSEPIIIDVRQDHDPDDDIPPDVGAMLIAVVVCAGVWGGIVWAVFRWLVK